MTRAHNVVREFIIPVSVAAAADKASNQDPSSVSSSCSDCSETGLPAIDCLRESSTSFGTQKVNSPLTPSCA